eukprot:TRINITY_DN52686_c0_g1_i1.p2 TRINITY_DN52686_c0_g1~~TRINITY_DN52686_c0_g1_i1.p2  ORF type:complete len:324 (+),score=78.57 TRINITY_DN52686_c0_g1_i1:71-1042(+)
MPPERDARSPPAPRPPQPPVLPGSWPRGAGVPDDLRCFISRALVQDPVLLPCCGQVASRAFAEHKAQNSSGYLRCDGQFCVGPPGYPEHGAVWRAEQLIAAPQVASRAEEWFRSARQGDDGLSFRDVPIASLPPGPWPDRGPLQQGTEALIKRADDKNAREAVQGAAEAAGQPDPDQQQGQRHGEHHEQLERQNGSPQQERDERKRKRVSGKSRTGDVFDEAAVQVERESGKKRRRAEGGAAPGGVGAEAAPDGAKKKKTGEKKERKAKGEKLWRPKKEKKRVACPEELVPEGVADEWLAERIRSMEERVAVAQEAVRALRAD